MKPVFFAFFLFLFSAFYNHKKPSKPFLKLSDYQFFSGNLNEQKPVEGMLSYTLNTPLFSDYAEKLRFLKLPPNTSISYKEKDVFEFPVGTILIKTFYYPLDFRKPEKGRKLIETRLLMHEADGWKALPYVWNEEQNEAFLEVAGESKEATYVDISGKKQKHLYTIPNVNQCKGCHNKNEQMMPIGPSARQLNGDFVYDKMPENQLLYWQKRGLLTHLPSLDSVPKAPVWNKPETGTLEARAKTWLDINCAHCHRPEGPASTSGLNLSIYNQDPTTYGIMKSPVAAGKASGNLSFDIVPQKPDESILVHRLASTDPAIRMPEVGRNTVHKESLELIKAWIKTLK